MSNEWPEGWGELSKILSDPKMDDLLRMRVEVNGRVFEIDALRLKAYVRTTATSRLIGKALCGKCMQQKHETTGFACTADGSCAILVCDDCLRTLLPESKP